MPRASRTAMEPSMEREHFAAVPSSSKRQSAPRPFTLPWQLACKDHIILQNNHDQHDAPAVASAWGSGLRGNSPLCSCACSAGAPSSPPQPASAAARACQRHGRGDSLRAVRASAFLVLPAHTPSARLPDNFSTHFLHTRRAAIVARRRRPCSAARAREVTGPEGPACSSRRTSCQRRPRLAPARALPPARRAVRCRRARSQVSAAAAMASTQLCGCRWPRALPQRLIACLLLVQVASRRAEGLTPRWSFPTGRGLGGRGLAGARPA